jgi:hypothetical protein
MPFELLLSEKARLPSFPNEVIQQIHYGETAVAECFTYCRRTEIRHIIFPLKMVRNQNNTMTKKPVIINFKLVIKYSSQITLTQVKTQNKHPLSKVLAKSLTLMTLKPK